MSSIRFLPAALSVSVAGTLAFITESASAAASALSVPGGATDASGLTFNRLGAFGSGLAYDPVEDVYYAVADRGSSQGLLDYPTRMHKFDLDLDPVTGAASNFRLLDTIMLTTAGGTAPLNGKAPSPANTLGLSFDPEGFALGTGGRFYVADEYGPSIYEFQLTAVAGGETEARMVRAFSTPSNLVPRDAAGNPRYTGAIVSGRQDNRGYEGLTLSPDGSKLYAILQGPLTEEGDHPTTSLPLGNGRYSRNVRIAEFDTASGANTAQYIYQLESLADVNARLPAGGGYAENQQGRGIGVSEILSVGGGRFWVFERDDRGVGDADPLGTAPVASKRIYEIDLAGATDVKDVSLAGTVNLPAGVQPVTKSLLLDVQQLLSESGATVVEKYESMTFGPRLADGTVALLIGSDNDMSMTRDSSGNVLLDIYVNEDRTAIRYTRLSDPSHSYGSIDLTSSDLGPVPAGFSLMPSYIVVVPEPGAIMFLGGPLMGVALSLRRRRVRGSGRGACRR